MSTAQPHRLDWGHFVDRVFWALLIGSIVYATSQLQTLTKNVATLNEKMAVVIEKVSMQDHRLDRLEQRIYK